MVGEEGGKTSGEGEEVLAFNPCFYLTAVTKYMKIANMHTGSYQVLNVPEQSFLISRNSSLP